MPEIQGLSSRSGPVSACLKRPNCVGVGCDASRYARERSVGAGVALPSLYVPAPRICCDDRTATSGNRGVVEASKCDRRTRPSRCEREHHLTRDPGVDRVRRRQSQAGARRLRHRGRRDSCAARLAIGAKCPRKGRPDLHLGSERNAERSRLTRV